MTSVRRPYTSLSVRFARWAVSCGPYLDQKQPPPTRLAVHSPHVQETIRKEGRQDVGDTHGGPKEAQAYRQLRMLIKVREVKDDLSTM